MEFRIQDLLKNLVPGIFLITLCSWILLAQSNILFPLTVPDSLKDLSEVVLVLVLGVTYIFGFFIDTIASLLEGLIYEIINVPAFRIVNSKVNRYSLANKHEIIQKLCTKQGINIPTNITNECAVDLFKTANYLKDQNPSEILKEKIAEYYNAYIFSRNLMTVSLLAIIFDIWIVINYPSNKDSLYIFLALLLLAGFTTNRWFSRAMYYCRQVLYGACH